MGLISEFKEFALKGNVVDMAIGVIVGAAFKDIVANGTDLTALAIGEELAQNEAVSAVGMGAMEVEAGFLSGFDNAEITGFKSGVMVAPMIGSIAFVSYVFGGLHGRLRWHRKSNGSKRQRGSRVGYHNSTTATGDVHIGL